MDINSITVAAYIVASLLFILSLAGLSKHESAKSGLTYGMVGMAVAIIATIALAVDNMTDLDGKWISIGLMVGAVVIGALIGLWRAKIVEMTGMPELIALLHSFVGLAAVLIGWNGAITGAHLEHVAADDRGALIGIHGAEVAIGIFIGAVTFTGSIVANLKLSAKIKSATWHATSRTTPPVTSCSPSSPPWRCSSAGTWWPRSAAATCRSSCRC
jgi:NAD(P) transhydrogenase subunit beta